MKFGLDEDDDEKDPFEYQAEADAKKAAAKKTGGGSKTGMKPTKQTSMKPTKQTSMNASVGKKKAAAVEEKAAWEAALLDITKTRLMMSRATEAAIRTSRMDRRGSIGGARHDMPQELMLPSEPINTGIKGIIRAAVRTRDMYICIACSVPAVVAARHSRGDGEGSSVARPEPRSDSELAFSEIARVYQDRATCFQRVGAEQ